MEKNKKMIAAVSAVVNYIKNEEDQMRIQAANPVAAGQFQSAPLAPVKMWSMNGRMSMMQIRNLMQIKAFHGF